MQTVGCQGPEDYHRIKFIHQSPHTHIKCLHKSYRLKHMTDDISTETNIRIAITIIKRKFGNTLV